MKTFSKLLSLFSIKLDRDGPKKGRQRLNKQKNIILQNIFRFLIRSTATYPKLLTAIASSDIGT